MDTREITGQEYIPRLLDLQIQRLLGESTALVIEGPRACGKTMTGLHHAQSYALLDDPNTAMLMKVSPQAVLEGAAPRLLDEWQLVPEIWNHVRRSVDWGRGAGSFILTGSAVPADNATRHTGAGRFVKLRQRTMTWSEKDQLSGTVSLQALLAEEPPIASLDQLDLDEVIGKVLTPGFPALVSMNQDAQVAHLSGYLDQIVRTDIPQLADVRQSPEILRKLITSLARATASELKYSTIAADLEQVAPTIKPETVASLVGLLERLFVVEVVPAFAPRLRSRARLRSTPKVHLADPALAAVALGADADALKRDLQTFGFLFESAVIHDLVVMTEALGGRLHHYRDSNGHEIDAVLVFPGGRWGAVEIKLGAGQISAGARSLSKAVAQIDMDAPPSFQAVITGTGFTAHLDDGVVTFPLSALAI